MEALFLVSGELQLASKGFFGILADKQLTDTITEAFPVWAAFCRLPLASAFGKLNRSLTAVGRKPFLHLSREYA